MMRQFSFEAEIYESLSCLPMAARRKLDRLGLKVSLEQWQQLSRAERLMICHSPLEPARRMRTTKSFRHEVSMARSGKASPATLSGEPEGSRASRGPA